MTPTTKAIVTEMKRNTRVLEEILDATDLRVAYKTETGWKRLYVSAPVAEGLRYDAAMIVKDRLNVLLSTAAIAAMDEALLELANEFNSC